MKAIVLSRRDFREYDQIVSVYTKDLGKQDLLARGIKKITSKNSAYLELFSFVDIEIIKGKELDYIGSVQPVNYFKNIRQDRLNRTFEGLFSPFQQLNNNFFSSFFGKPTVNINFVF